MPIEPDFNVFRTDRSGIRTVLGDLEAEVMEVIWERPVDQGTTVRDVFEVLYERRRIAYTTVMNTMTRLAKKQLLRTQKIDQAYVYYPNFTKDAFVSRFVGHVLENLVVNFTGVAAEHLAALSDPQAVERMRELLEEIARRRATEEEA